MLNKNLLDSLIKYKIIESNITHSVRVTMDSPIITEFSKSCFKIYKHYNEFYNENEILLYYYDWTDDWFNDTQDIIEGVNIMEGFNLHLDLYSKVNFEIKNKKDYRLNNNFYEDLIKETFKPSRIEYIINNYPNCEFYE